MTHTPPTCAGPLVITVTHTPPPCAGPIKLLGGDGRPKRETKVATVDLPLEYEIGLDITPGSKVARARTNIIHFTTGTHESKLPCVHFLEDSHTLAVIESSTGLHSYLGEWMCDGKVLALKAGNKYRLRVVLKKHKLSVHVNEHVACLFSLHQKRKVVKNVRVYVGSPWRDPADVMVQGLYLKRFGGEISAGGRALKHLLLTHPLTDPPPQRTCPRHTFNWGKA